MTSTTALVVSWLFCRRRALAGTAALAAVLVGLVILLVAAGDATVFGRSELGAVLAAVPSSFLVPVAVVFGSMFGGETAWSRLLLTWKPRRVSVAVASLAVGFVTAWLFAAALSGILLSGASLNGAVLELDGAEIVQITVGSSTAFAVWALLSSAVATLSASRIVAFAVVLPYWMVVQPIVRSVSESVAKFLPAGALATFSGASTAELSVAAASACIALWCALLAAGSVAAFSRRDFT